ncbi:MAG TPA: hypothetical protein VM942_09685 [Acidimicrobiales bacterium]|nr:hypothetical protein [Acidimicrobiales bacterium]
MQRTAGNRAVTRLLSQRPRIQRLQTISQVVPPGERATPQQALTRYVVYLISESWKHQSAGGITSQLESIRARLAEATAWTSSDIGGWREEIDQQARAIRDLEGAKPAAVDSDITPTYVPLKACVLQSLEQIGKLGMTAADYHAQLWKGDDALKYYDMDTVIGPMYARFGLTEVVSGEKYKDLCASLPVGRYIMNVESPAGPNGHMFYVEIKAGAKNKPNIVIPHQDPKNTQGWQPSDKILRYWTL